MCLRVNIFYLPDKEKCVNRIGCIAQNLKSERLFGDDFAVL